MKANASTCCLAMVTLASSLANAQPEPAGAEANPKPSIPAEGVKDQPPAPPEAGNGGNPIVGAAAPEAESRAEEHAEESVERAAAQAKEDSKETRKQIAEAPGLSGFRNGSLGFPGEDASAVAGMIKLQSKPGSFDPGLLAKAGTLDLFTVHSVRVSVDILGEMVQTEVPFVQFPVGQQALPTLKTSDLLSLGARLRISTNHASAQEIIDRKATRKKDIRRLVSKCLTKDQQKTLKGEELSICQPYLAQVKAGHATPDEVVLSELKELESQDVRGPSLALGGRFLYRDETGTSNSAPGVAAELALKYAWTAGAAFVSGALSYLDDAVTFDSSPGGLASLQEAITEGKTTVGAYWQGRRETGVLSPRVGAYYSLYLNSWNNRLAFEGTDPDIRGRSHEAALFVGGSFSNGVSGIFSFGVRTPYGRERDPQFLVSFSPAFGQEVQTSGGE